MSILQGNLKSKIKKECYMNLLQLILHYNQLRKMFEMSCSIIYIIININIYYNCKMCRNTCITISTSNIFFNLF